MRSKPTLTRRIFTAAAGALALLAVGVPAQQPASATLDNLIAAFNGESNAHAKYVAFAERADAEGHAGVAALFRAAARAEEVHAGNHAEVIRSLGGTPEATIELPEIGTTVENLQAAIEGESYERDTMYPEFIAAARRGRQIEAVRYLGINTPRIEHPSRGPGPYADAAYEANRRLVEGQWVYLLFEGSPRDRHGRLLAYVWVGDVFVNATLVHRGYAEAALASRAGYAAYFRLLQEGAQRDGRGLWREPDAHVYHRPRPTELAADEEGGGAILGGRVFSAPAPFLPAASPTPVGGPAVSSPAVSAPAVSAPRSRPSSPSYVAPRRSLVR